MIQEMLLYAGNVSFKMKDDPTIHNKIINGIVGRSVSNNIAEVELNYMEEGLITNFIRYAKANEMDKKVDTIIDTTLISISSLGIHDESSFKTREINQKPSLDLTDENEEPETESEATLQ